MRRLCCWPLKAVARFWARVDYNGPGGCWLWTACKNKNGYGWLSLFGKTDTAHRVAYALVRGLLPPAGLELDHLCRVRHCVNPDHMEPVTHHVNMLRGNSPTIVIMREMKCKRGHDLSLPQALAVAHRGDGTKSNRCRVCHNARSNAAYHATRERRRSC